MNILARNKALSLLITIRGSHLRHTWHAMSYEEKIATINAALVVLRDNYTSVTVTVLKRDTNLLVQYREEIIKLKEIASYAHKRKVNARNLRRALKRTRRKVI